MARSSGARYIQFYVDGTAALKPDPIAPAKEKNTVRTPAVRKKKVKSIYIDPVATFGIVVALCMLVLMLFGVAQLNTAKQAAAEMGWYVANLSYNHAKLSEEYEAGYNLDDIEEKALALGMIPSDTVQPTVIDISVPETPEEGHSLWEQAVILLTRLFA